MTTEIKPGKWRLKDGREVVVLVHITGDSTIRLWLPSENLTVWWNDDRLECAEYLGPAVIGEPVPDVERNYWVKRAEIAEKQCKQLEAETLATRELLEQSEKRCEELQAELGIPIDSEALKAAERDEIAVHRFKSVTVMVRGEREVFCWHCKGTWIPSESGSRGAGYGSRPTCEQWCREQIEPRWREATEGDVGKACRVRDHESETWSGDKRTLVGRNENIVGGPWATVSSGGSLSGWRYCEVQE